MLRHSPGQWHLPPRRPLPVPGRAPGQRLGPGLVPERLPEQSHSLPRKLLLPQRQPLRPLPLPLPLRTRLPGPRPGPLRTRLPGPLLLPGPPLLPSLQHGHKRPLPLLPGLEHGRRRSLLLPRAPLRMPGPERLQTRPHGPQPLPLPLRMPLHSPSLRSPSPPSHKGSVSGSFPTHLLRWPPLWRRSSQMH